MNSKNGIKKQCRICGDQALGFNFNGLSCESCKAFFRRNALKQKVFKCRNNDKCVITKNTRKNCKQCRLIKCYLIGMKRELIWCFRDHHQKNSEKNVEFKEETFTSKDKESSSYFSDTNQQFTDLNPEERRRVEMIDRAMSIFPDESRLDNVGESGSLLETFSLPGNYIPKYIRFCKQIEAFKSLSSMDQMIVFKKFYCEISAIRFSSLYNKQTNSIPCLNIETGNTVKSVNLAIFGKFGRNDLMTLYQEFCLKMNEELDNDTRLVNLVVVYFLFNKRENISCPEFISYNQAIYDHLIRRYLETKYQDFLKADRKYSSLMETLAQVENICETVETMYLSFNAKELGQVLSEIYDMK